MQRTARPAAALLLTSALLLLGAAVGQEKPAAAGGGETKGEVTLRLAQEKTLVILAMTDLHLAFPADRDAEAAQTDARSLAAVGTMARACRPDVLLFLGDLWNDGPAQGLENWTRLSTALADLGVPWAVAWGNHDLGDHARIDPVFEQARHCLFRGTNSGGNYTIRVRVPGRPDPVWNLIVLNSDRTGLQQAQLDWFGAEAHRLKAAAGQVAPAFVFLHIPLPQFRDAGEPRPAGGTRNEAVHSLETVDTAFAALKAPGWVKAVFCGHDHLNDFFGSVDGIRLQYVRSTGYGGYGDGVLPKGATLITVDLTTQGFATRTVFPEGTTSTPGTPAGRDPAPQADPRK